MSNENKKKAPQAQQNHFSLLSGLQETVHTIHNGIIPPNSPCPDITVRTTVHPEHFGLDPRVEENREYAYAQSLLLKFNVDAEGMVHLSDFQYAVNGDEAEFNKKFEHIQGRKMLSELDGSKDLQIKDIENYNNQEIINFRKGIPNVAQIAAVEYTEGFFGPRYNKLQIEKPSVFLDGTDTSEQTDISRTKGKSFLLGRGGTPCEISPETAAIYQYYDRTSIEHYANTQIANGMNVEQLKGQLGVISAHEASEIAKLILERVHENDTTLFQGKTFSYGKDGQFTGHMDSVMHGELKELFDATVRDYIQQKENLGIRSQPDFNNPMDVKRYVTTTCESVLERSEFLKELDTRTEAFRLHFEREHEAELKTKSAELEARLDSMKDEKGTIVAKDPITEAMYADCQERITVSQSNQRYLEALRDFKELELEPIRDRRDMTLNGTKAILDELQFPNSDRISQMSRDELIVVYNHLQNELVKAQPDAETKSRQNQAIESGDTADYGDKLSRTENIVKTAEIVSRLIENHPDNFVPDRKNIYEYGEHDKLAVSESLLSAVSELNKGNKIEALAALTPEVLSSKEKCVQAREAIQAEMEKGFDFIHHEGTDIKERRTYARISETVKTDELFKAHIDYIILEMEKAKDESFDREEELQAARQQFSKEFVEAVQEIVEDRQDDYVDETDAKKILLDSLTSKEIEKASENMLANASKSEKITMESIIRMQLASEILDSHIHSMDFKYDPELCSQFKSEVLRSDILEFMSTPEHHKELLDIVSESRSLSESHGMMLDRVEKYLSVNMNASQVDMDMVRTVHDDFFRSAVFEEVLHRGLPEGTTFTSIAKICDVSDIENAFQDPAKCASIIRQLDSEISRLEDIKFNADGASTFVEDGQLTVYRHARNMITEHIIENTLEQLKDSKIDYQYNENIHIRVEYTKEQMDIFNKYYDKDSSISDDKYIIVSREFMNDIHNPNSLLEEARRLDEFIVLNEDRIRNDYQENEQRLTVGIPEDIAKLNDPNSTFTPEEKESERARLLAEYAMREEHREEYREAFETLEKKIEVSKVLNDKISEYNFATGSEAQQILISEIQAKEELILYIKENATEKDTVAKVIARFEKDNPESEITKNKDFIEGLERAGMDAIMRYRSIESLDMPFSEAQGNALKMDVLLEDFRTANPPQLVSIIEPELKEYLITSDPSYRQEIFRANMIEAFNSNPEVDYRVFREYHEAMCIKQNVEIAQELVVDGKWNENHASLELCTMVSREELMAARDEHLSRIQEKMSDIIYDTESPSMPEIKTLLGQVGYHEFADRQLQEILETKETTSKSIETLDYHIKAVEYDKLPNETKELLDTKADIARIQDLLEKISELEAEKKYLEENSHENAGFGSRWANLKKENLVISEDRIEVINKTIDRHVQEIEGIARNNGIPEEINRDNVHDVSRNVVTELTNRTDERVFFENKERDINHQYGSNIISRIGNPDMPISEESQKKLFNLAVKTTAYWTEEDKATYMEIVNPRSTIKEEIKIAFETRELSEEAKLHLETLIDKDTKTWTVKDVETYMEHAASDKTINRSIEIAQANLETEKATLESMQGLSPSAWTTEQADTYNKHVTTDKVFEILDDLTSKELESIKQAREAGTEGFDAEAAIARERQLEYIRDSMEIIRSKSDAQWSDAERNFYLEHAQSEAVVTAALDIATKNIDENVSALESMKKDLEPEVTKARIEAEQATITTERDALETLKATPATEWTEEQKELYDKQIISEAHLSAVQSLIDDKIDYYNVAKLIESEPERLKEIEDKIAELSKSREIFEEIKSVPQSEWTEEQRTTYEQYLYSKEAINQNIESVQVALDERYSELQAQKENINPEWTKDQKDLYHTLVSTEAEHQAIQDTTKGLKPNEIELASRQLDDAVETARACEEIRLCIDMRAKLEGIQSQREGITDFEVLTTNHRTMETVITHDVQSDALIEARNAAIEAKAEYEKMTEVRIALEHDIKDGADEKLAPMLDSALAIQDAYKHYAEAVATYNDMLRGATIESEEHVKSSVTEAATTTSVEGRVFGDDYKGVIIEGHSELSVSPEPTTINNFIEAHKETQEFKDISERYADTLVEADAQAHIEVENISADVSTDVSAGNEANIDNVADASADDSVEHDGLDIADPYA